MVTRQALGLAVRAADLTDKSSLGFVQSPQTHRHLSVYARPTSEARLATAAISSSF